MRIYVDFDDVICETAQTLSVLAGRLFGVRVPFEEIAFFDLHKAFGLDDNQYNRLMEAAHSPEVVLSYAEIPGASGSIRALKEDGHAVEVVTGRPFSTRKSSRQWLDERGLSDIPVIHVDKYGREPPPASPSAPRSLTTEEFSRLSYDFAVEDSPAAFGHLARMAGCRIAVFARPWNARAPLPGPQFMRAGNWESVMTEISRLTTQEKSV